jgi:hypothetical protein
MKKTAATQTVDTAIDEIKTLVDSLDSTNTNKLATDLYALESKASALRSLILNKVIRTA